jgi:hypothetical protein
MACTTAGWVGPVGGGNVQLGWQPPDARIEEAARLGAGCDVAAVFASHALGEGMDRTSLALPGDQDRLIAAVAAANPRTVVVLNTGGPVLMPWRDQVGAVLQAWHAGQQFGEEVSFRLDRDDLAAFDEASGEWVVHPGSYEVLVGRSAGDVRSRGRFEVGAGTAPRS